MKTNARYTTTVTDGVTAAEPRWWTIDGPYRISKQALGGSKGRVVSPVEYVGRTSVIASGLTDIVTAIARVHDETSLLGFANQYGLLGFSIAQERANDARRRWHGDPVSWALAHARIVAAIVDIRDMLGQVGRALGSGSALDLRNVPSVPGLWESFSAQFRKMGIALDRDGFTWTSPENSRNAVVMPNWRDDLVGTTWNILALIINPRIRETHFEMVIHRQHFVDAGEIRMQLGLRLHCATLLDAIYWKLAGMLGDFRSCPVCGRVFSVRDPRQEYCSTQCGAKARQRRLRSKRKTKRRRKR